MMISSKHTQILSPSPNYGERVGTHSPHIIVLHYTGMNGGESALARLCDHASEVSCHYVIMENGDIIQLVDELKRAWHAGKSAWQGMTDLNSCSIGIEIANGGHDFRNIDGSLPAYSSAQILSVIALCQDLIERWNMCATHVLAHSDIAPMRKQDPGEHFPWHVLYAEGVGHWVEPQPLQDGRFFALGDQGQPIEALQTMLSLYGYGLDQSGIYDDQTMCCVKAFQRHFRTERIDGIADASTIMTLHQLLKNANNSHFEKN